MPGAPEGGPAKGTPDEFGQDHAGGARRASGPAGEPLEAVRRVDRRGVPRRSHRIRQAPPPAGEADPARRAPLGPGRVLLPFGGAAAPLELGARDGEVGVSLPLGKRKPDSGDRDVDPFAGRGPQFAVAVDPDEQPRAIRAVDNAKLDRKSTRLNSSHLVISYAVF